MFIVSGENDLSVTVI